jgi:branched-chain amino acid aminotransferase group I
MMLDDQDGFIWMDGELVKWRDAKIHVLTHTLHYGSGVFEGARAYNGKMFESTRHHERLHASAGMMGFKIPYSVEELNAGAEKVLKANNFQSAYVRPIAWHGSEALGVATHGNRIHACIAAWNWGAYYHNESLTLMWSEWVRPAPNMALVHAKANGQYIMGMVGKNKAEAMGFDDAVMLDYRGYVAECTSSNIFFVKNGELMTPTADCFLNGITRQTVLALAKANGIPAHEVHVKPEEFMEADEVFVTGSAAEIQPVGKIADKTFKVGPITRKISALYGERVGRQ